MLRRPTIIHHFLDLSMSLDLIKGTILIYSFLARLVGRKSSVFERSGLKISRGRQRFRELSKKEVPFQLKKLELSERKRAVKLTSNNDI